MGKFVKRTPNLEEYVVRSAGRVSKRENNPWHRVRKGGVTLCHKPVLPDWERAVSPDEGRKCVVCFSTGGHINLNLAGLVSSGERTLKSFD